MCAESSECEGLRSDAWRQYVAEAQAAQAHQARLRQEFIDSPERHPEHGLLLHMGRRHLEQYKRVLDAISNQACTYVCQETRDGVEYGVCTCEAMIPGVLDVDWTLVEFWQMPGHFGFDSEERTQHT